MTTDQSHPAPYSISRALILAALLLGVAAALRLLSPHPVSPETARRSMGVLLGVVVIVYANAVPKALSPLTRMRGDPAAEQNLRRFTGWSLVSGGVGYALAWLFAPLNLANALAGCLLGAALLLVVIRVVGHLAGGSRA